MNEKRVPSVALGKTDSAIICFKNAINIEGEIGDKRGIARLKIRTCLTSRVFDDTESQMDYFQESLALAKELEDSSTIATTLMDMGNIILKDIKRNKLLFQMVLMVMNFILIMKQVIFSDKNLV